jgi:hypothetical protein
VIRQSGFFALQYRSTGYRGFFTLKYIAIGQRGFFTLKYIATGQRGFILKYRLLDRVDSSP